MIAIKRAAAARAGASIRGELEQLVAFQLRIAQAVSFQAFAELTGYRGLRPGYFAILQVIYSNPGISQTELSRAVGRDKTTLTPTLKDMERTHLIERLRDPDDGRGRMLALTARGEEARAQLAECARQHDNRVDTILGTRDRKEALRILNKLIVGLETLPHVSSS